MNVRSIPELESDLARLIRRIGGQSPKDLHISGDALRLGTEMLSELRDWRNQERAVTDDELDTIEAMANEAATDYRPLFTAGHVLMLVAEVRRLRALVIDLGNTPDPIERKP